MPQSEIQRVTIVGLRNYRYATSMTLTPDMTGFGPFAPVSLDGTGSLIKTATALAAAWQAELETEAAFTGLVGVVGSYEFADAVDGVIRHYDLATSVVELTGEGVDGTLEGGATITAGGVDLDGAGDYVSAPHAAALNLQTGGTIWVRATLHALTGERWLVGKDDHALGRSWCFGAIGGTPTVQINGTNIIQTSSVSINTEYDFCLRGDPAIGWELYVNGTYVTTASWVAPSASTAPFNIGRRSFAANEGYVDGLIKRVRICDYAASVDEIKAWSAGGDRIVLTCEFDPSLDDLPELTIGGNPTVDGASLVISETVVAQGTNGTQAISRVYASGASDSTNDNFGNTVQTDGDGFYSNYFPASGWTATYIDGLGTVEFTCDTPGVNVATYGSGGGNVVCVDGGSDPTPEKHALYVNPRIAPNGGTWKPHAGSSGIAFDAGPATIASDIGAGLFDPLATSEPIVTYSLDQFGYVLVEAPSGGDLGDTILAPEGAGDLNFPSLTINVETVQDGDATSGGGIPLIGAGGLIGPGFLIG